MTMRHLIIVVLFMAATSLHSMECISDIVVSAVHSLCPMCYWNADRQAKRLENALNRRDHEQVSFLLRRRGALSCAPFSYRTLPLVRAAELVDVEAVRLLLAHNAHPDSKMQNLSDSCPSALIAVCAQSNCEEHKIRSIVDLLLDAGADPELQCVMLMETEDTESDNVHEYCVPRLAENFAQKNGYFGVVKLLKERRLGLKIKFD